MDLAPDFNVTATIDGFAIRYGGKLVDEFPGWEGAVDGLKAAREALVMLDRVLSSERA